MRKINVQIKMSEAQKSSSSSPRKAAVSTSESDERFFRSLAEFIEREKESVRCPEEGPDPLRYMIYHAVFSQVYIQFDTTDCGMVLCQRLKFPV